MKIIMISRDTPAKTSTVTVFDWSTLYQKVVRRCGIFPSQFRCLCGNVNSHPSFFSYYNETVPGFENHPLTNNTLQVDIELSNMAPQ
jgi:hypothetical protein